MMRRLPPDVLGIDLSALPQAPLDADRARLLALRIHGSQLEPTGAPLIAVIRFTRITRVAVTTFSVVEPVLLGKNVQRSRPFVSPNEPVFGTFVFPPLAVP